MPEPIRHQAISAAAGSGKTFQLAHRYIRLMARGASPDRINALTFSRKAAGEIFDSIVAYLTNAAESDEEAERTSRIIHEHGLTRADYLHLLRNLLDHMHRLNTGTLDSFTIKIVQSFPMELGIGLDFQVMDNGGSEAAAEQHRVLQHIFSPRGIPAKARREFFQAFKDATYGREEKSLTDILDTFIRDHRARYMQCDDPDRWGNPATIWPEDPAWMDASGFAPEKSEAIKAAIEDAAIPENIATDLAAFIDFARDYTATKAWPEKLFGRVTMKRLFEQLDALAQGPVTIQHRRDDIEIPAEISRYLHQMAMHLLRVNYHASLEQTRGLYQVLKQYEEVYDRLVRRRGRLTFDDAQYLLTPGNHRSPCNILSRQCHAENRLYIDYRLNARLDHWLLDEFQDTSDTQWAAFENLVDEIVQDPEGERTFFYVGDVKQAIYRWRGGNTRLFNEILERYPSAIELERMSDSYRSCPDILHMVNRVFHRVDDHEKLPREAVTRWNEVFQEHKAAPKVEHLEGYCALLEPLPEKDQETLSAADRYDVVAGLLKEIKPLERGLSVAILIRKNTEGEEIARHLRDDPACRKMHIVREGASPILDDPFSALLINLIRFTAHPGNTLARRHVEMSPLMPLLEQRGRELDDLPLQVLDTIHNHGFRETLLGWITMLREAFPFDRFVEKRAGELLDAAAEFDARMCPDLDAFTGFMESYQRRETASADAVRIMTIHQSKGLGFDIVILPELMGGSMRQARTEQVVTSYANDGRSVNWILKMPRKFIADNDPVLRAERDRQDAEHCFDELCVLYVAMTRAKRGMYLVSSPPRRRSPNHAHFIKSRLAIDPEESRESELPGRRISTCWEAGKPAWYKDFRHTVSPGVEPAHAPTPASQAPSRRARLARRRPSDPGHTSEEAGDLFQLVPHARADFGTAIHGLFEEIAWLDQADIKAAIEAWKSKVPLPPEMEKELVDEFLAVLDDPGCRSLLSRPEGPCELWREQAFEIVLDQQWISGVIDRAHIAEDRGYAEIIDFKSNRMPLGDAGETREALERAVRSYQPQLHLYRRALARMYKMPEDRIRLKLLFTHPARVVEVD
jgi:ATP-dependent exoDNAse (exonuclease V) beta subunit